MKTQNAYKMFDYIAIMDHKTVCSSNYSHPTGVLNLFTGPSFPILATAVQSKTHLKIRKELSLKRPMAGQQPTKGKRS